MKSGNVVLVGRPNAGKSMLLNAILGRKVSIVSDKPQTTRNRILGILNEERGQVVLIDTPGVHKPLHRMNVRMMDTVVTSFDDADALVAIADASESYGRGDEYLLALIEGLEEPEHRFLVLNKIDLVRKDRLLPLIETYHESGLFDQIIPISALTGDGRAILLDQLFDVMPEGEPRFDEEMYTTQPERFFAAEIVREKLLHHTRDELPFTTAVRVDQWEEEEGRGDAPFLRIFASILVERPGQKKIVIGRGGSMIRQIGTEARKELEEILGAKIYLDLHVRVEEGWRENERVLNELA